MIGRTLAHYRILERLGPGGASEVYRARDTKLGRDVALKILPRGRAAQPERIARFEQEARAVAALQHPNIITIYSVDEFEGVRFFTMEMVEGASLSSLIPERGLERDRFFEIAVPLADALGAAHDRGVIHSDIKPSNIVVAPEGRVKMLDFGLARLLPGPPPGQERWTEESELPVDGAVGGTIPYMSPEQLQGSPASYRSDIFSFGVLLYEMATGRRPFPGTIPADLVLRILEGTPRPVEELRPDLPRRLAALVHQCLEKEPGRRPKSAVALRDELEDIRDERAAGRGRPIPSIAVLPFVDMSPDRDQEHLCDGLAEELINRLARIRNLHVASRTSTFMFKNTTASIRDIGSELHVDTVLEGSVRKAGDQLRITVQLTSVADGFQLWSERFDREMGDFFAVQDEMAQKIVQALQVRLRPGEEQSIQATTMTNVQAYDYYLRGRRLFYHFRRGAIEQALRMFSLSIRHDPDFALAYAGISDCWCYLFLYADRRPASLDEADRASRKAMELNPGLAEVHTSRGQVLSLSQKHEEAEAEFETALRLGPKLFEAHYLYGRDCFAQGRLEKAARLFEQACEARHDDYQAPLLVAQIYADMGRGTEAAEARRRGVRIAEERLKLDPNDVRAVYMGANGLIALGEREKALEWAGLARSMEPGDPMVLYNLGCIYSLAGETAEALDCLEKAVQAGLTQKGWFDHDSNLDPLRQEPRFKALQQYLQ